MPAWRHQSVMSIGSTTALNRPTSAINATVAPAPIARNRRARRSGRRPGSKLEIEELRDLREREESRGEDRADGERPHGEPALAAGQQPGGVRAARDLVAGDLLGVGREPHER